MTTAGADDEVSEDVTPQGPQDDPLAADELVVGADQAGQRLDVMLASALGHSRSRAANQIQQGEVTVGGAVVSKQYRVRTGDRIAVALPTPVAAPPAPPLPPVRYRDEHLLVIAKPPGLVVHPGAGTPHGTLVDALRGAGVPLADVGDPNRPGIVHRLDRDTSGLLAVASSSAAAAGLVDALKARTVTRRYLALAAGLPGRLRGRIEGPIGRDPDDRLRFAVTPDGRPATTRYVQLAAGTVPDVPEDRAAVSLLACRLLTGRTHQIRVHLAALGHPVVGDATYGAPGVLARGLALSRPFLHAAALGFVHPVTGATIELVEPLPDDLAAAAAVAGITVPDELPLDDD